MRLALRFGVRRAVLPSLGRAASCVALVTLATLVGCKTEPSASDAPDATASPQAKVAPAPLAEGAPRDTRRGVLLAASASAAVPEGGVLPVPLRGDVSMPADPVLRESVGYTLSAVFRTSGVALPPRSPESNLNGIEAARRKTELRLGVDLAPSRMRVALAGQGFLWPAETELRARSDRYGHVVVWPGGRAYRPLAPGAMRAFFGERRLDVGPITAAEILVKDDPGKRIGVRTRKVELTTRAAKATLEIGKLAELGEGGVLLCRLLVDLMNAPPGTVVCGLDELPMRAELHWTTQGSIAFEITGVLRRTDVPAASLAVPPPNALFMAAPPEAERAASLLSPEDLGGLRTAAVEVPAASVPVPDALSVANTTEQLRVLFIDGVPVMRVAPGAEGVLRGLTRGRYLAQWRTFLGDVVDAPQALVVPGFVRVGEPPEADADRRR